MSEEFGVRQAREHEQRFGHVVLQASSGDVYSLDLYQGFGGSSYGIACRGYYLPSVYIHGYPSNAPVEIELTADTEALDEIGAMFSEADFTFYGREDRNGPFSGTFTTQSGDHYFEVDAYVSAPVRRPDRTTWSGRIGGTAAGGLRVNLEFVLEQYGTVDPVTILLFLLFILISMEEKDSPHRRNEDQEGVPSAYSRCEQKAVHHCGEGNIRSINITRSGNVGTSFGISDGCQFECFERRDASGREGDPS